MQDAGITISQPSTVLISSPMAGDPLKRPPVKNLKEATIHLPTVHRLSVIRKLQITYGFTLSEAQRMLADAAPVLSYRGDTAGFVAEVVRIGGMTQLARIRIDSDVEGAKGERWYAVEFTDQNVGYTYTVRHRAESEQELHDDLDIAFGPNLDVNAISGPFDRFVDVYRLDHVEPGLSGDDLPECDVPDGPPVLMAGSLN